MNAAELVSATGCTLATAQRYEEILPRVLKANQINTPLRITHFLANAAWESARFERIEEDLDYRADRLMQVWPVKFPSREIAMRYAHAPQRLANYVYANINGNGSVDSGDGWNFRGRGWGMLTGRRNYARYTVAFPEANAVSYPDALLDPFHACNSFGWFWRTEGCNEAADADDAMLVRRRVNGPARMGLEEVIALTKRAKSVLMP